MPDTKIGRLRALAKEKGLLRARELSPLGIPRKYLSRLTERGELVRIGRGLYHHADHEVTAQHSLAVAAKRVPKGVLCLLTALRFHELTTQNPPDVWLAIGHKDRAPQVDSLSLCLTRMSGAAFAEGIEKHEIEGVTAKVYSPAKTVADCFKFRSKVGLGVALEALKDYHRTPDGSMDALWRQASVCRVQSVMRPYMEAVVA